MLVLHLRQYANCQRAIDKTKYQLQLGAILLFKCHCIRMQLVVMPVSYTHLDVYKRQVLA